MAALTGDQNAVNEESKAGAVVGKEDTSALVLKVSLRPIDENNVGTLRVLNRAILPVQYKNKFYRDILQVPEELRKMAYHDASVVGAVCCRVEQSNSEEEAPDKLYIMTLGVLAAYRNLGVGSKLLKHILLTAAKMPDIGQIYLHMHTQNVDGLRFYKRFGFQITKTIKGYYTNRVVPPDCHVLTKENAVADK